MKELEQWVAFKLFSQTLDTDAIPTNLSGSLRKQRITLLSIVKKFKKLSYSINFTFEAFYILHFVPRRNQR